MNLAFVSANKGLPWGGSEELWAAAAERALSAGHRVAVCVYDWSDPAPRIASLRAAGATIIPIPLKSRPRLPFLPQTHAWLNDLDRFAPSTVCISQGQEYDLAGRRWGRAMLKWLASRDVTAVSVVQYNDDRASPTPRTANRARQFIAAARVNAYVAQRNIEQTQRQLGITIPNAVVVRNPVNLADTNVVPWPAGQTVRFACVARLHAPTKGQDLLLAALARPVWRQRDWKLSFCGVGPDETAFREMAGAIGIAERIEFRGFVSDVRSLWQHEHVLVLSSRGEGTPLAMVEAMLLGRPCVVTDVGDCAAWVREGHEGTVAPAATVDGVGDALERAWAMRDRWPELGAAAGGRARSLFDPDAGQSLLNMMLDAAAHKV